MPRSSGLACAKTQSRRASHLLPGPVERVQQHSPPHTIVELHHPEPMEHSWNLGSGTTVQPVGMGVPSGGCLNLQQLHQLIWGGLPGPHTEVQKTERSSGHPQIPWHRVNPGTHTHYAVARAVELIDSFNFIFTTEIL